MAFSFTVDTDYAKKHNEYLRDAQQLQRSGLILAGILAVALVIVWFAIPNMTPRVFTMIPIATIMVTTLCVIPMLPRKMGTAQQMYDRYDLVPAMIAQVDQDKLVLLALVDTAVPEDRHTWALSAHSVTSIPDVPRTVGAKVPSVGVTGRLSIHDKEHWGEVSAMPIAWGTRDMSVIADAAAEIPQTQWDTLEKNLDRVDEVLDTTWNMLDL